MVSDFSFFKRVLDFFTDTPLMFGVSLLYNKLTVLLIPILFGKKIKYIISSPQSPPLATPSQSRRMRVWNPRKAWYVINRQVVCHSPKAKFPLWTKVIKNEHRFIIVWFCFVFTIFNFDKNYTGWYRFFYEIIVLRGEKRKQNKIAERRKSGHNTRFNW